jgi:tRNA threonylcarbamoyladenosine biosynthesis protein TsaE
MQKEFITENLRETQELGKLLAKELIGGPASTRGDGSSTRGGEIICLTGDLGAGKTTFAQGFLEELGAEGPYTSPTFLIMRQYEIKSQNSKAKNLSHIDAYRVVSEDILNLGWEEIVADKSNVIIVEWAERIRNIIPEGSLWINFEWVEENKRKIIFNTK